MIKIIVDVLMLMLLCYQLVIIANIHGVYTCQILGHEFILSSQHYEAMLLSTPIYKSSGILIPCVLLLHCPWHETLTSWSKKAAQALAVMSPFKPAKGGRAKETVPLPSKDILKVLVDTFPYIPWSGFSTWPHLAGRLAFRAAT